MYKISKKIFSGCMCMTVVAGMLSFPVNVHASDDKVVYNYSIQYRYHRYTDDSGDVSLCPYYGSYKYNNGDMELQYTDWLESPLSVDNGGGNGYVHVRIEGECDDAGCIDSSMDTDRYRDALGTFWYYEETRIIETYTSENDEIDYAIIVSENNDLKLWNAIGVNIFSYSLDVVDELFSLIPEYSKLEVMDKLLENKVLIKMLADFIVNGDINVDEKFREEIESFVEDYGVNSDMTRLLYERITNSSDLEEDVWYIAIKYTPRLFFDAVSGGAAEQCLPIKVVICVYEASTQNFWDLGDAIGKLVVYETSEKKTADVFAQERYSDFKSSHNTITDMVTELAIRDALNGNKDHYDIICEVAELMCSIRGDIAQFIDKNLSSWGSIWNRRKSRSLKNTQASLNGLDLEYEALYNRIYSQFSEVK